MDPTPQAAASQKSGKNKNDKSTAEYGNTKSASSKKKKKNVKPEPVDLTAYISQHHPKKKTNELKFLDFRVDNYDKAVTRERVKLARRQIRWLEVRKVGIAGDDDWVSEVEDGTKHLTREQADQEYLRRKQITECENTLMRNILHFSWGNTLYGAPKKENEFENITDTSEMSESDQSERDFEYKWQAFDPVTRKYEGDASAFFDWREYYDLLINDDFHAPVEWGSSGSKTSMSSCEAFFRGAVRMKYKAQSPTKLPDVVKSSKGSAKYLAIIFIDIMDYYGMEIKNRELLDKYCAQFKIGIVGFLPLKRGVREKESLVDEASNTSLPFAVSFKQSTSSPRTALHPLFRILKKNLTLEPEVGGALTSFSNLEESVEPLLVME